jgi:hypothetical protein
LPTAAQAVLDAHDTSSNWPALRRVGIRCIDQDEPFQRSASGAIPNSLL